MPAPDLSNRPMRTRDHHCVQLDTSPALPLSLWAALACGRLGPSLPVENDGLDASSPHCHSTIKLVSLDGTTR